MGLRPMVRHFRPLLKMMNLIHVKLWASITLMVLAISWIPHTASAQGLAFTTRYECRSNTLLSRRGIAFYQGPAKNRAARQWESSVKSIYGFYSVDFYDAPSQSFECSFQSWAGAGVLKRWICWAYAQPCGRAIYYPQQTFPGAAERLLRFFTRPEP